ncbi:TetR/AcrR family transcriptional regulator [Nostocoides sp. HKS02]|uniref:TetR/AcrR family transcriptional regulator n=1 Tax=Nostocoides sp. HKS02 TaxID=1813880 RepID=UPI0012B4F348|nr:TetR/AcrR family transcriptional regulator [Tetrasphaera sp. HKS02]QGN58054.1 TetR family transcriptional regulator [Tetrasphaera sp. HKS02]
MLGETNVDRVSRRRQGTRNEILDAAWAVVRESGWSGLTQRSVAQRVGMRAPSLYGHFDSKLTIIDAMFGQAWAEFDATAAVQERDLPDDPRAALLTAATTWLDAMAADPERNALMNQRPVPGFTPSAESYAFAVQAIERLHRLLNRLGITDPDAADLWTAILAGLASQQNANDPGGQRWRRLLPRAVDMFLTEVRPDTARRKKAR